MPVLDRKLLRDLARMWAQVLAIALVMACGVMTIVIMVGAYRSLEETRDAFYERYRFATVFAQATRAPLHLREALASISGVASLDMRIVRPVLLDIEGTAEPATGIAVSIPDHGEPAVNRIYFRTGRMPEPGRADEVAVLESFAEAHRMEPGSTFRAIMNGRARTLKVTAVVLSPEYVYALGPGDFVPDPRRFGVFFMSRSTLEGLFDMDGAFNSLAVITLRNTDLDTVIESIDAILKPFGGTGAHGRDDQVSDAFLDAELTQLRAMAFIIPPIFLAVAAFLVNMILTRLITLEREQVGLLKAIGYADGAIAWHYAKLTIVIALVGVAIGAAAGNWLGIAVTRLYGDFYSFPFLIFRQSLDLYLIAAAVSVGAALAGAVRAIWRVVALPPAVAMQPPAPTRYRRVFGAASPMSRMFSQLTIMALRHLIRWPVRASMTALGASTSVALLVTSLFAMDSIDFMMETVFFRSDRQDASLTFVDQRAAAALQSVAALPGVLRAEPFRAAQVILRNGHRARRLVITGVAEAAELTQILDQRLQRLEPPAEGLVVSERVASLLDLQLGDLVEVELLEHGHRLIEVPVTAIVQSYVGLTVNMRNDALDRLIGDGRRHSGARVALDEARLGELYDAVKRTPAVSSIALQGVSRERFRATIEENISISTTIYIALAAIITFGVIYNSARIQLSERARELASLRVLGFTRAEVSSVLLVELAAIVLAAQPLGWAIGYLLAWGVVAGFESDLFRIPFIIEPSTYATASLVAMIAAALSALIVRRRIDRFDLVEVLKTRD